MLAATLAMAVSTLAATTTRPANGAAAAAPVGLAWSRADLGPEPGGVASIARNAAGWWAAGSFVDAQGEHRPGLWFSADLRTWERLPTVAVTGYGEVSELYSVAASDRGVVAIGMATGGAHGNPRTVSWVLGPDRVLHEVRAEFELYNGIRQMSVRSISAAPGGWVIIGSRTNRNDRVGATAWTSPTGDPFTIRDDDVALSSGPKEQVLGLDVTLDGDQLLAVGEWLRLDRGADTDGIVWRSSDGITWSRWAPPGLQLGGTDAQRLQRVAVDGRHVVIGGSEVGVRSRFVVWTTTDRLHWRRTVVNALGTSDDALDAVTSVAVLPGRTVVGARRAGALVAAVSEDDRLWRALRMPSGLPVDARAVVAVAGDHRNIVVGAVGRVGASGRGGGLWIASDVHVRG